MSSDTQSEVLSVSTQWIQSTEVKSCGLTVLVLVARDSMNMRGTDSEFPSSTQLTRYEIPSFLSGSGLVSNLQEEHVKSRVKTIHDYLEYLLRTLAQRSSQQAPPLNSSD